MTSFVPRHEPCLPQNESTRLGLVRKLGLRAQRQLYQFDYTHVSPLAVLKHLPIHDDFSLQWLRVCGERVMQALDNRAKLELDHVLAEHAIRKLNVLRDLAKLESALEFKLHVVDVLKFDKRVGAPAVPAKTLQDYADLFRSFGLPPISKDFTDDRVFAAMRTSGPNPVMIKRMKTLDERMPITNALFQEAVPDDSLDAALAEGRLYLADYALLDGAELSTYPNGQKYVYAPLALFVVTRSTKELLPVAIQCKQQTAADNPIFTPKDGYNWLIAKTIVETADGNVHEASTHLGRTHLTMEAFVVASYRRLAANHPLALLLWPHFEGTLAINRAAWKKLIADKGGVDKLMGGSIETSRKVAVHGVQSTNVMHDLLPLTFAQRDVGDHEAFPNYPYRDDSSLYWDAIHEWVRDYLSVYYTSDSDVQQDEELKSWSLELASDTGGRIRGLPNDGIILHLAELIEVATYVIFTCSVQHAAVNFPQYDCMSYVPNMPLAGYRPAPTSKTGATEADFIAMLPTLDMAELQMELGYLLGTVHYTELGKYPIDHFTDPRLIEPLHDFQMRLIEIGQTIRNRNQSRRPYDTLSPTGIPQSINI